MAIPLIASPAAYVDPFGDMLPDNDANFTSTIGNWVAGGGAGTPTRDATVTFRYGDLPASLKFVTTATGQYAEVPVTNPAGLFKAGVEYHALVAVCIEESYPTPASVSPELSLGIQGTDANGLSGTYGTSSFFGNHNWFIALLRWKPTADRSSVKLRVKRIGIETGTMTWHVGVARVLRVHPGTLGLAAVFDPGYNLSVMNVGGADAVVAARANNATGWRDRGLVGEGWYVGNAGGTGVYTPDAVMAPGFLTAGALNPTNVRRGAELAGYNPVALEVGPDFVGVAINERSITEVEVHPDYADYDVILMDGSTDTDVKHWWHEEADGTYKASAGRKSRIGLYFQKAFHVTGAQTTGTAKNEPADYYQLPFPCEIDEVRVHLGTVPTGSTFIVDVNINGTTIFTTQANRPTVAISASDATSGAPDTTKFVKNDRLSFDIDQIGSTIAGSDLTVMVRGRFLW